MLTSVIEEEACALQKGGQFVQDVCICNIPEMCPNGEQSKPEAYDECKPTAKRFNTETCECAWPDKATIELAAETTFAHKLTEDEEVIVSDAFCGIMRRAAKLYTTDVTLYCELQEVKRRALKDADTDTKAVSGGTATAAGDADASVEDATATAEEEEEEETATAVKTGDTDTDTGTATATAAEGGDQPVEKPVEVAEVAPIPNPVKYVIKAKIEAEKKQIESLVSLSARGGASLIEAVLNDEAVLEVNDGIKLYITLDAQIVMASCTLGADVGADDCKKNCKKVTQAITVPATGEGSCKPNVYVCVADDGKCGDEPVKDENEDEYEDDDDDDANDASARAVSGIVTATAWILALW